VSSSYFLSDALIYATPLLLSTLPLDNCATSIPRSNGFNDAEVMFRHSLVAFVVYFQPIRLVLHAGRCLLSLSKYATC
jgi:hypothetical protein